MHLVCAWAPRGGYGGGHELVWLHYNRDECRRPRSVWPAVTIGPPCSAAAARRYALGMEATRCPTCRKLLREQEAFDLHVGACPGAHVPDVGDPSIALPIGAGVHCWACGRNRLVVWLEPDFCCKACKAVLLTVGKLE